MSSFVQTLTSFFKGSVRKPLMKIMGNPGLEPAMQPIAESEKVARELSAALRLATKLLVVPTPAAIRDVSLLLEEAQASLQKLKSAAEEKKSKLEVHQLNIDLKNFRCLVEGALRVQWGQMRTVIALTQSYAPGGKISRWQPASPKVDLKV